MMLKKKIFLFGVLTVCLAVDVSAKVKAAPASSNNMILKELLLIFSDTKKPETGTAVGRYSNIQGIKWRYGEMEGKNKNIYNNSRIKVEVLKDSEVIISGRNGYVDSIELSDSEPNRQFKKILEANLGKGAVTELVGCRSEFIKTEKAYQISFKDRAVIYVNADANFSFEPYMSPLYTYFEFTLTRPNDWKC